MNYISISYSSCCDDLCDFRGVNYNTAMMILLAYDESHQTLDEWNGTPVKFIKCNWKSCSRCRH